MSAKSTTAPAVITNPATISGFNRGPVTSLFVAPSSCTATLSYAGGRYYYAGHWEKIFDDACFPTVGSPVPENGWQKYYYSPAICPAGWNIATTFSELVPVFPAPTVLSLGSATTAALCCPSGFGYKDAGHVCSSTVTEGQDLTVLSYTFQSNSYSGSLKTIPQLKATYVVADGLPIMWQASDSEVLARAATMTPTPQLSTGSIPISATASPPATPLPSATSTPSPSSGLSTGAKIGLGIGIPVVVISFLVIGFFFWERRRGKQSVSGHGYDTVKHVNEKEAHVPKGYGAPGYGAGYGHQASQPHYELQTETPGAKKSYDHHELPTNPVGANNSHELPTVAHR